MRITTFAGEPAALRARGLDSVELGHLQVHEHHVGGKVERRRDRLAAVGGGAEDVDVVGRSQ
ncbi:MAG TPA: hypothetical protein VG294_13030 [Solirubrobacteraceae bacterium]|nr:hypothetical protein [Solirubrobacteraceae bacterium]